MKVSIISWIHDRAHLLAYSLDALARQLKGIEVELNVADEGSTDNLDELLQSTSLMTNWTVRKFDTSYYKNLLNNEHNCPAAYYNALVALCDSPYIIKLDPEFVFISNYFVGKGLNILEQGRPAIIMPLPHHINDFQFNSLEDLRNEWASHEYPTHINRETAPYCNVYYGCIFSRQAYIDLGGIDLRFNGGIGSEDDHLLDQWRRKYGGDNVITLLEEQGLHLWHGGFSAGVPEHLYHHVNRNADLRTALANTYPNDGQFYSIAYPNLDYVEWRNGVKVVESGNISVKNTGLGQEVSDGIVIGYVDRM
jgi:hypothetical protein